MSSGTRIRGDFMNETQLKTFLSVAEKRSYSKTAVLFDVTQPTVTSRIKSLEDKLKCKLFKRIGHDIFLTEEGHLFINHAENILNYIKHSKEIVHTTKEPVLKVGFSPGYSYSFIVDLLKTVQTIGNKEIKIIEGYDSVDLNDRILSGDIDLVFTRMVLANSNDIISEYLFENKVILIASNDHPLSQKEHVSLADLNGETILSYRRDTQLWRLIDDVLLGVENITRIELDNNEMLKQAVANNIGIATTLSLGIDKEKDTNLTVKEITELSNITNDVYVQYRKNISDEEVCKKIIYSFINHKYNKT